MMGHCRKHCTRTDPDHWGRCVGRYGDQWAEQCPLCAHVERVAQFVESLPTLTPYEGHKGQVIYRHTSPAMVAEKIRSEM